MKSPHSVILLLVVGVFFTVANFANAEDGTKDWDAFSKNLVKNLKSSNDGIRVSAMQQVIVHADNINVDNALLDVLFIYRNHRDERVRQMALTTLFKMDNTKAWDFLKRYAEYEKSPKLKKQIYAMFKARESRNLANNDASKRSTRSEDRKVEEVD